MLKTPVKGSETTLSDTLGPATRGPPDYYEAFDRPPFDAVARSFNVIEVAYPTRNGGGTATRHHGAAPVPYFIQRPGARANQAVTR